MAEHNELGEKGEQLAIDYLQKNGYKILEKNYRYKKAEVDVIAQKDGFLVVVEVKTRSSTYFGNPESFVNPKKIKLLVFAINNYVNQKDLDLEVRFDIIAIVKDKEQYNIRHLTDAFLHF
ncbi:YraN family protein [Tenacibaculum finnmarkense]|uniref:YraN family protein n=1 Tax=Tenacibaculum finnmarkense TaxID=2781243 RepID=UPI001E49EF90|nr:YraN family protein [Tenacibaculum finnmarkense]MCD8401664.1 YraN family protein [Tenacibaculum finnmarkense genomovar finnmarkense]MCD8413150.1 YraN family protein [Tenacibaculum finnmarkense genomovar ulcerans]MCD8446265.1 YraN family protein [Tenacibaculum finnmarkense genomovar finnmarkense]MCG8208086.1 YraN family protein [Tenacibaculum finnmarkense genomovar finnmarkense]MCG8724097.1 YraN family protein [Tenacibaculum finnmarkense]